MICFPFNINFPSRALVRIYRLHPGIEKVFRASRAADCVTIGNI